ncbi:Gx transporter family protein [Thiohalorhabdus methylotrophus]|uniref:Gx transporter family protein n=1 Tax=Thiohalorhabdus methylotrophus TaxID=3242694 RepID=A0ABV4TS98_9GAMM
MPSITEGALREPPALSRLRRDTHLAWMAAFAVGLHLLEAALPPIIPGLKPGLANVVTVTALCLWGWRTAAMVTLLRVVVAAIFLGTLLAPGFWLSLGGALAALAALALGSLLPGRGLGPVGYSVLAAVAHIGGQLAVAYALFVQHAGLFALVPILGPGAAITGTINGLAAYALVQEWESRADDAHGLASP